MFIMLGCISIETTHIQYTDGSADVTQEMDMGALTSYAESYSDSLYGDYGGQTESIDEEMEAACDEIIEYYPDVKCEYINGKLTVSKHYTPENSFYKFEVKEDILFTKYRLTVDQMPTMALSSQSLSSSSGFDYGLSETEPEKFSETSSVAAVKMLQSYGMESTYVVKMPGSIVKADGAIEFDENSAEFDVLEMMIEKEPIVVESEKINLTGFMIIIVGILVLVALLIFVASRISRGETHEE